MGQTCDMEIKLNLGAHYSVLEMASADLFFSFQGKWQPW